MLEKQTERRRIEIRSIVLNNLGGNYCGPLKTGCLNVITDIEPDFIYERVGNYLFAEHDGFVHCYSYVKGSTKGFAGREITLRVFGGTVFTKLGWHIEKFKGCLWDSVDAYRAYEKKYNTRVYSCAQKSYEGYRKCPVFTSCYVNQNRMDEIAESLKLRGESK